MGAGLSGNATTSANGQSRQTSAAVVHHMTIRDTELVIVGQDCAYVIDDPVDIEEPSRYRSLAVAARKVSTRRRFVI